MGHSGMVQKWETLEKNMHKRKRNRKNMGPMTRNRHSRRFRSPTVRGQVQTVQIAAFENRESSVYPRRCQAITHYSSDDTKDNVARSGERHGIDSSISDSTLTCDIAIADSRGDRVSPWTSCHVTILVQCTVRVVSHGTCKRWSSKFLLFSLTICTVQCLSALYKILLALLLLFPCVASEFILAFSYFLLRASTSAVVFFTRRCS